MFLKGPWEARRLNREEPSRRVTLPANWQTIFDGSSCGCAEFRRRFNQPTNLEAHEHVWIVFQGVRGAGWVSLNGQRLGGIEFGDETAEFEITPHLAQHNELVVQLTFDVGSPLDQPGGLWGPVALEIRSEDQNEPRIRNDEH
jgi:beta-galactosidase/beta-glucuronidase